MSYGYYDDGEEDKNLDAKLKEIVGKNPVADSIVDDDTQEQRYAVFGAVCDLKCAAEDLYCEGEMGWDEMIQGLGDAILKLKGKEQELIDAHAEDEKENEDNNQSDKED